MNSVLFLWVHCERVDQKKNSTNATDLNIFKEAVDEKTVVRVELTRIWMRICICEMVAKKAAQAKKAQIEHLS
jgi:hypothetical protein